MINMCELNSWITTADYSGSYTFPYCKCPGNNNCRHGNVQTEGIGMYNPIEPIGEKQAIEPEIDLIPLPECSSVDDILERFEKDTLIHIAIYSPNGSSGFDI